MKMLLCYPPPSSLPPLPLPPWPSSSLPSWWLPSSPPPPEWLPSLPSSPIPFLPPLSSPIPSFYTITTIITYPLFLPSYHHHLSLLFIPSPPSSPIPSFYHHTIIIYLIWFFVFFFPHQPGLPVINLFPFNLDWYWPLDAPWPWPRIKDSQIIKKFTLTTYFLSPHVNLSHWVQCNDKELITSQCIYFITGYL